MKDILQERFFQLLLECSQRKVSVTEFTEAIEELATHLADFSCNEQDYSVLLRYFSFGLHAHTNRSFTVFQKFRFLDDEQYA